MAFDQPRHLSFMDVCAVASETIMDIAGKMLPPPLIREYASSACIEFAAQSECARSEQKRVLVAGQRRYRLPLDCLKPLQVSILYPNESAEKALDIMEQRDLLDNWSLNRTGSPESWCLTSDRKELILHPEPEDGGGEFITTSAGNVGGTTVVLPTGASTSNDFYNGMTLRIVSGALEGEEKTISDYDGATLTATVPAFSAQVPSGARVEIAPDTLKIQYVQQGNPYIVTPTDTTVQSNATAYNTIVVNLPDRPPDYWRGCEVWFTSGSLLNYKTRILAARSVSGTSTTLTLYPELHVLPAANDTVKVTDVPNIPERYHRYLPYYIISEYLYRIDKAASMQALARFETGIANARRFNDPPEGENFDMVREHRYGEEWSH